MPYISVTLEGPVTSIKPLDLEHEMRPMARRYLGPEGNKYVEYLRGKDMLFVRMRPEKWATLDYSKDNPLEY